MDEAKKKDSKEVELIKIAIDHLLGAGLAPDNGWTEEEIQMLRKLLSTDFEIVKKKK